MLPQGWIKFKLCNNTSSLSSSLASEITAYYNYNERCFSFSPILNPLDFLTISVRSFHIINSTAESAGPSQGTPVTE